MLVWAVTLKTNASNTAKQEKYFIRIFVEMFGQMIDFAAKVQLKNYICKGLYNLGFRTLSKVHLIVFFRNVTKGKYCLLIT